MTSSNLALWETVERTDPKHVKAITGKSYQGTSPKPHYLVHKATEAFGPCGIGWGFTIVSEPSRKARTATSSTSPASRSGMNGAASAERLNILARRHSLASGLAANHLPTRTPRKRA